MKVLKKDTAPPQPNSTSLVSKIFKFSTDCENRHGNGTQDQPYKYHLQFHFKNSQKQFKFSLNSQTMASSTTLIIASFLLLLFNLSNAAQFNVVNKCSYTVWAAAVPGGGQQLDPGQSWTVTANPGTTGGRVWARTGCNFDANGNGHCQTGDCGGLLQCQAYGAPPNTLAEYALNQYMNLDFYDISLVDGFNVPMDFSPTAGCHDIRCTADVVGQCPGPLRTDGGCNNPCTVFKTDNYCCNSGSCQPTDYSRFFKNLCPDAYSYPKDDQTSTFTCPSGTNYNVVFCP